jgi:asparagine synthase (glutamine-hydrolysing)
MCGIFGDISVRGKPPSIDDACAITLRDMLAHRGPDGAGLWRHENALLAHRRLAIIDPTPNGAQPMATPDGRYVISYNGELYNDAALRTELIDRGVRFRSACDTETVLEMYAAWGIHAFDKLRGEYALAIYDTRLHTLTLARDPLGVKPLYYWLGGDGVVFASEPAPIVSHPKVPIAPDWRAVSAYCSTIRCVLGERTLFEGVRAVRPGEAALFEFDRPSPGVRIIKHWQSSPEGPGDSMTLEQAGERVWATLEESVTAHLRSDVPVCSLLSGGIDSAATSAIATSRLAGLRTYCAGAESGDEGDDLSTARLVAKELGTRHAQAIITREHFTRRWPEMVAMQGFPCSTPNEVAINAVAERLRADGCIVTISGEGADELLAGYESNMDDSARFVRSGGVIDGVRCSGGAFQLHANSWIPVSAKAALFREGVVAAIDKDAGLIEHMDREFRACEAEVGDSASSDLAAHLRFHRRVNLTGLLRRLDSATMLASVEGRAPFADRLVASAFEAIPMACKYEQAEAHSDTGGGGAAVIAPPRARTKLALRRACEGRIPERCINRPKASFPLPFQAWIADHRRTIRDSPFAREVFTEAAVEIVAADPAGHWRLAWPMLNLAMWGDRWFV